MKKDFNGIKPYEVARRLFIMSHEEGKIIPNWVSSVLSFTELSYITGTMSADSNVFQFTVPHVI